MGEGHLKSDYRGFSVVPGVRPIYAWDSTSLNAPLRSAIFKKMPLDYQKKIEARINSWANPEMEEKRLNF